MTTGRGSDCILLSYIIKVVLLTIKLSGIYCDDCPNHCTCVLEKYECYNGTVALVLDNAKIKITCKNTNLNIVCADLPRITVLYTKIEVENCPANIVTCISDPLGLDQPLIRNLFLINMPDRLETKDVSGLEYLHMLEIQNNDADTPVPIFAINSLKYLKTVRIVLGGKQQLSSNYKFNSTSLTELYLYGCDISSYRTDGFTGLPNLRVLFLYHTNIQNIHSEFFRGIGLLKRLILYGNNLKSIEADAFIHIPRLNYLSINEDQLESLPDRSIKTLKYLRLLQIVCPDKKNINTDDFQFNLKVFSLLPAVRIVILENCFKLAINSKSISEDKENAKHMEGYLLNDFSPIEFTNVISLKYLKLRNNAFYELPVVMFTNTTSLESLNLNKNEIREVPHKVFKNLRSLVELNLSENRIKAIHEGTFSDLEKLKVLNLSNNAIEVLTKNVFQGLKDVTELYLQNNNIKMVEVTEEYLFTSSPFRYLPNLTVIDLSNNKISKICNTLAIDMPQIQDLNLANNHFKDIREFQELYRMKNITIDLSENNISYIRLMVEINQASNDSRRFNSQIRLNLNPIICDCTNYGLFLRAKGIAESNDPNIILGNSTCRGPPQLKGKLITELSLTDLVCNVTYDCPNNCTCQYTPAMKEVTVDCKEIPAKLPSLWHNLLYFYRDSTYTLNLNTHPATLADLEITTLNLTNTDLDNITFSPNDHIQILDVSHNNLTTISDSFLKTNITLYVANNPLQCDCSLVENLKEHRVADYKLVYCADGKELSKIDVRRLCAWKTILFGYICLGTMAGIFVFKIGIAIFRYIKRKRMIISRVLFRRGSNYSITIETRLDIVKDYDLFISFAHEDTEFVMENLLPKLENKFKQKVCVHHRDWVVGELIDDQIIQSVESARRTVIILTEAFILSEWSYLEFRTAHNMSIREGRPRVIIILLNEDIIHDKRLRKDIKSYTSVNTYLVWGDPEFWHKLKRILPNRGRK